MNIKQGHSRIVFLFKKHVVKFPVLYFPCIFPFKFLKQNIKKTYVYENEKMYIHTNEKTYIHSKCSKNDNYSYYKSGDYFKVTTIIKSDKLKYKIINFLSNIRFYYINSLTFKIWLEGLLNNLIETEIKGKHYCPVLFSFFGLFIIM